MNNEVTSASEQLSCEIANAKEKIISSIEGPVTPFMIIWKGHEFVACDFTKNEVMSNAVFELLSEYKVLTHNNALEV